MTDADTSVDDGGSGPVNQIGPTPFSFLSGFVQDRNTARVIAQVDQLRDQGSTASRLMKWTRDEGQWMSFRLEWTATRMWVLTKPEMQVFAIGPDGIVSVGTSKGMSEEEVDPGDDGPRRRGPIRDLQFIGSHLYVAGMSRQVYRREAPNRWMRQDDGAVLPRGDMTVAGFNSIDGLDENDIYAVGFNGEIWRRSGEKWRKLDSPTNLVLHRVRVIRPDLVFICGQEGVLMRGSGERWRIIEHDATAEDFWGMEWFGDRLYLACDDGLYVLAADDSVNAVDTGLAAEWTTRHLHTNDGVLWSFGPKSIAWTEDGRRWNDVTP